MNETAIEASALFEVAELTPEAIERCADAAHESFEDLERFDRRLREQLAASPTGPAALRAGLGLLILGRHSDALDMLAKAPDDRLRWFYAAQADTALARYADALAALKKAAAAGWDAFETDMLAAGVHLRTGDAKAADALIEKHMRVGEDRAAWYYARGLLLESRAERAKALECYDRALTLAPEHEGALFHAAWLHDLDGDDDHAIGLYERVAQRPRAKVNALLNLAVIYEDLGFYREAVSCVRRVLRVNPNHTRARLFLKDVESSRQMVIDEIADERTDARSRLLDAPISEFELSVRARNCLKKMNIHTLGQLVQLSETELLAYKNFGEASLNEIKQLLARKGLRLGQRPDEIDPATLVVAAAAAATAAPVEAGPRPSVAPGRESLLSRPVAELELSVRSRRCLQRLNIGSLSELVQRNEAELLATRNFGVTSLNEIKARLADLGLSLAIKKPD